MSSLKQNIRTVLSDVQTFLVETLKSVKLNSSAKDHKDRLLEKILQLLDEIPGSASSQPDSNTSGGSLKISGSGDSGSGTSSSNPPTLADEESGYADNITKVAASDLKNKLQTGMLDKKKKSGFKTWEPLYCAVSGNIFYMYKKQEDSKQKGAFCLNGYEFQEAPGLEKDTGRKEMCFEVTKAGALTYQFRAGSKEGMVIWKEAITKGIQIVAEEEPGDDCYEKVQPDLGSAHKPYVNLHELSGDDDGKEIYEYVDDMPSFHAPPVPRAALPPLPERANAKNHYANLPAGVETPAEPKTNRNALRKTSAANKSQSDPPATTAIFDKSTAREGLVFPSEVKKGVVRNSVQSAEKKRQGPPPMIDIYKECASDSVADDSHQKGVSTTVTTGSSAQVTHTTAAANQANLKSPLANLKKKQDLRAPPTTGGTSGAKLGQVEGKERGSRFPSSSQTSSTPSSSSAGDSPQPQGSGVRDLTKMFEN